LSLNVFTGTGEENLDKSSIPFVDDPIPTIILIPILTPPTKDMHLTKRVLAHHCILTIRLQGNTISTAARFLRAVHQAKDIYSQSLFPPLPAMLLNLPRSPLESKLSPFAPGTPSWRSFVYPAVRSIIPFRSGVFIKS
jgi:hypothetical protein